MRRRHWCLQSLASAMEAKMPTGTRALVDIAVMHLRLQLREIKSDLRPKFEQLEELESLPSIRTVNAECLINLCMHATP